LVVKVHTNISRGSQHTLRRRLLTATSFRSTATIIEGRTAVPASLKNMTNTDIDDDGFPHGEEDEPSSNYDSYYDDDEEEDYSENDDDRSDASHEREIHDDDRSFERSDEAETQDDNGY
jgi:hypothetical protein